MTKIVTRLMAATAAIGIVAAPIVAQAKTRASSSAATYSVSNSAPGLGRAADGEGQAEGGLSGLAIGAIAGTTIILGALVAGDVIGDDDDEDGSPGT